MIQDHTEAIPEERKVRPSKAEKNSVLTKAQWNQLMVRSLRGEDDKTLSADFGVPTGAIRQRRAHEPVWATAREQIQGLKTSLSEAPKPIVRVEMAPLSITEIASQHPELIANFVTGKITEAIDGNSIPSITSWNEFKIAMEMVRKSCGMDANQTNIQVNLWSGSSAQRPSVVVEAEITVKNEAEEGLESQ